jgi:hypothetical protein
MYSTIVQLSPRTSSPGFPLWTERQDRQRPGRRAGHSPQGSQVARLPLGQGERYAPAFRAWSIPGRLLRRECCEACLSSRPPRKRSAPRRRGPDCTSPRPRRAGSGPRSVVGAGVGPSGPPHLGARVWVRRRGLDYARWKRRRLPRTADRPPHLRWGQVSPWRAAGSSRTPAPHRRPSRPGGPGLRGPNGVR